ncbi:hypothetical protein ACJX0J_007099 [Zea mays]
MDCVYVEYYALYMYLNFVLNLHGFVFNIKLFIMTIQDFNGNGWFGMALLLAEIEVEETPCYLDKIQQQFTSSSKAYVETNIKKILLKYMIVLMTNFANNISPLIRN